MIFQNVNMKSEKNLIHCLAVRVKPIVSYQYIFKTTYLYGSYSQINGDCFVWEINGVNPKILEVYLKKFSLYKP
jgi:hypothetical protein